MSGAEPSDPRVHFETWLLRHRFTFAVLSSGAGENRRLTVVETQTNKQLSLDLRDIVALEEARQAPAGSSYLKVQLADGRSFAVTSFGFVFAPSFLSTGPLPECPPTASFVDYERLRTHLDHLMLQHPEEHAREALQLVMVLLAFLEGARMLGFSVGEEERELEVVLERLEKLGLT